jgi:uncharacterized protein
MPAAAMSSSIKTVAVNDQGKGVIGNISVEVTPGDGRILVDATHVLTGFDTQESEKTAVKVVGKILNFDFSRYDAIFTIYSPNAQIIDGGSAGAAMTLVLISAITGQDLRDGVMITGTIQEDGSIGPVDEIFGKAEAAAKSGVKTFLIPKGQSRQHKPVREVERCFGYTIERVHSVPIDMVEYAVKEWGMNIVEVGDIHEAANYVFYGKTGLIDL